MVAFVLKKNGRKTMSMVILLEKKLALAVVTPDMLTVHYIGIERGRFTVRTTANLLVFVQLGQARSKRT